uniref:Uncharacterized protein n=1 Tax=Arundo donax TaxID=35708 RepID=A0A0A9G092_ARUDO
MGLYISRPFNTKPAQQQAERTPSPTMLSGLTPQASI